MEKQKNMSLRRFLFILVTLLTGIPLSAQTIKVSGHVVDATGVDSNRKVYHYNN